MMMLLNKQCQITPFNDKCFLDFLDQAFLIYFGKCNYPTHHKMRLPGVHIISLKPIVRSRTFDFEYNFWPCYNYLNILFNLMMRKHLKVPI